MPVLRINAQGTTPVLHGVPRPLRPVLKQAVTGQGPIVILLHGYKFRPHHPRHCPHQHIFALQDVPCRKAISWPRHLGMTDAAADAGLAIAFGWNARGSLPQAHISAKQAAQALATLIRMIRRAAPMRPLHLMAHSMGAYLALKTMLHLQPGDISRMLALNAAVYRRHAEEGLDSPAGRQSEAYFMVSRENAIYDWIYECAQRPDQRGDRAIGRHFSARNAVSIDLSSTQTLERLAAMGHHVPTPDRRFCHWSTYLRPGVFPFYQSLLRAPHQLTLARIKSEFSDVPPYWPLISALPPLPGHPNQA